MDNIGKYLKSKGIKGVLVGTGMDATLSVETRKRFTELWFQVSRKYDLKIILNIGGLDLPEVYEFAENIEKLKVDAVIVMPDLFYQLRTVNDLVEFLNKIPATFLKFISSVQILWLADSSCESYIHFIPIQ